MTMIQLDTLIEAIDRQYPGQPLEQLTAAVLNAQAFEAMADDLVGHYVERARSEGSTWSEIGGCLGVTKQAAQKRFTPKGSQNVFARFTDEARRVILLAQEHARDLRHTEIEPEHLLLGVLDLPQPAVLPVLPVLPEHLTPALLRERVLAALPAAAGTQPALIPFSDRARAVLEETVRVAERREAGAIGTEHLVAALESDPAWASLTGA